MDPYVFKRLWRRPWLSLCSLILSATLCFLMGYLSNYRQNQMDKLQETKEQYDILCVVTDRRGTRTTSLRMNKDVAAFLMDESEEGMAQYVRDLRITKEYSYTCPALGIGDYSDAVLVGVSNERCDDRLNPEKDGKVTYLTENFYEQSDYICLVSEQMYKKLDSDTFKIMVEDPFVSPQLYGLLGSDMIEITVAGYYAGGDESIFISFDASQRLADEMSGGLRSSDSVSFLAADNETLDQIYDVAAKIFGKVDPNATDKNIPKIALTIHDEQYRATVAALEQNIARTGYLLPVVLVLGLGVGFLISFLYTRNERKTYALMRTLGTTRGKLFGSILREQLLLVAVAALAALAVTKEPVPTAVYFTCYAVGCGACIIRAIRVPPTAILRDQE